MYLCLVTIKGCDNTKVNLFVRHKVQQKRYEKGDIDWFND